jgi:hypothetical protein
MSAFAVTAVVILLRGGPAVPGREPVGPTSGKEPARATKVYQVLAARRQPADAKALTQAGPADMPEPKDLLKGKVNVYIIDWKQQAYLTNATFVDVVDVAGKQFWRFRQGRYTWLIASTRILGVAITEPDAPAPAPKRREAQHPDKGGN